MKPAKLIEIAVLVVVLAIVLGLFLWTVTSPAPLAVQSQASLQSGLFGYSKTTVGYNISDGSGIYHFEFGLDYSQSLAYGSPSKIAVYSALVSEQITSFFTRGVALTLESSSLSIDGRPVADVTVSSKFQSDLETYYFQIPAISSAIGNHTLQIRILFSTIDVDYVGNSLGSYQPVVLNGTFAVSS